MSNSQADFRLRTRFIIKLGRALHHCGANSVRIEEHLGNVTKMLGLKGSFLVSPTTFTYIFWEDDEMEQFTHTERMQLSDYDLGSLWEIDRLVESMEGDHLDLTSALKKLEELSQSISHYTIWEKCLSCVVTGGAFALLLSPNPLNAVAAALVSFALFLIGQLTGSKPGLKAASTIIHAFTAGVLSVALSATGMALNVPIVILASIIINIPGLALTVALEETSHGHLISGCSRLIDAITTLLKLIFGTLAGIAVANFFVVPSTEPQLALSPLPDLRI
ncbi:threonine/serine exporter family protein [Akkermansiaceae bacterium]|nr:threonine/serine exporter family protein [Akkermansiaceae bacterium]